MSNKNGTGFKDIEPGYQLVVQQYMTKRFIEEDAKNDEDEYRILADTLRKAERGEQILDDVGNPNNQLLSIDWNDERVTADLALNKQKRVQPKDYLLVGGVGLLVIGFLLYSFGFFDRSKTETDAVAAAAGEGGGAEEVEAEPEATIVVTPISQQSLEIATSLGGAIKIAEPRTLDVEGVRFNQTYGIVPVKPKPNGSMQFLPEEKRDSAVVWVQGTVINYVFGGSTQLVNGLEINDTIHLRSNTGQRLTYRVSDIFETEPQRTEIFSQKLSPGITLFELPATGLVRVVRALYQSSDETVETTMIQGRIGETVNQHPDIDVVLNGVYLNQMRNGLVRVEAEGVYVGEKGEEGGTNQAEDANQVVSIIAFLGNNDTQFTPITGGQIREKGDWHASWEIPEERLADVKLFLKPITSQQPIEFNLSDIPHPRDQLNLTVTESHWDIDQEAGVFSVRMSNNGDGDVYIFPDEVLFTAAVSQKEQPHFSVSETFPLYIPPGEGVDVQFSFQPSAENEAMPPVQIQVIDAIYEIQIPAEVAGN
jgi:hypothetical protein